MKIQIENNIISGQDWSKVDVKVITENEEKASDVQSKSNSQNEIETCDYFPRYNSLFNVSLSPFNLGLYQTPDNSGDILRSTQYVGIMPLMPIDTTKKTDGVKVKILSRFHISPTEMLNEVLSGMDYYNNPEMLSVHSYSSYEWKNLSCKNDDNKILFGIINGFGAIDLYKDNNASNENTDLGIIDTYGAFEIIDFVNKAKTVCKKNLKRQSQRTEENLYCKVRGKIVIQKQIKYNASKGQNHRMYCSYNSLSEDIKENQIIKYALHLCQKNRNIADSLSEDILFCLSTLSGVPLKKVSIGDFTGLKNNGAYRQYRDALHAAKKIISRYGLSYSSAEPKDDNSDNNKNTVNQKNSAYSSEQSNEPNVSIISGRIMPHFIDMNLLFEYYCRALFRKAIDEFNQDNKNMIVFELESTKQAKKDLLPKDSVIQPFFMEHYIPDIVITYTQKGKTDKPKVAAVFDAKYSNIENQYYKKRERTHQILFYMQVLGCKYGGLISPYNSNEFGNECLSGNVLINGSETDKNPVLFYIPLDKKDSSTYTARIIDALKEITLEIYKKIEEQEKNSQLTKATNDLADILIENEEKLPKKFLKLISDKFNEIKKIKNIKKEEV